MKKFTAFAALAGIVALTACFAAFAQDDAQALSWHHKAAPQGEGFAGEKPRSGSGSTATAPAAKN